MRPRAVLFDCDGVIVDSEPMAFALLGDALAAAGLPMPRSELEALFLGSTIRGVAERARGMGADLAASWVDDFYETLYARLGEGTPLIPGIEAVMARLDARGILFAVGSNGTPRKMEITLGQHPAVFARLEGLMFSGQVLGRPKPDPALYLHAARALGVVPEHTVVIDDSASGCGAGLAAGMRTLGFAAAGDGAALAGLGVEVFHLMDDLPGLLDL